MPVLLTPTVTSPSFNPSPLLTSSRLGLESAIQRSWAGFVYTPTFFLVMVVVADMLTVLNVKWGRRDGGWSSLQGKEGRMLVSYRSTPEQASFEWGCKVIEAPKRTSCKNESQVNRS